MPESKYLIVVVGPTAVGKTATCIKLANHYATDIVSADSRQFYREMHIGTAKPAREERGGVKHHFIHSHSISEDISAGQYEKMALKKLEALFKTQDKVILTGGSGLYINAVTAGMAHIPAVDPDIRKRLNNQLENEGLEPLLTTLHSLDRAYYQQVDRNNPHRIIRALEVTLGTGKPFSSFRKAPEVDRPFKVIKIGLNRPRKELYERINMRMGIMIEEGLFDEARKLYPYKAHNALQTVGYKEIFDYMDGLYDREEAIRLLKRNSRRYAKRQLTWFNKDEKVKWFHPDQVDDIRAYIDAVT